MTERPLHVTNKLVYMTVQKVVERCGTCDDVPCVGT